MRCKSCGSQSDECLIYPDKQEIQFECGASISIEDNISVTNQCGYERSSYLAETESDLQVCARTESSAYHYHFKYLDQAAVWADELAHIYSSLFKEICEQQPLASYKEGLAVQACLIGRREIVTGLAALLKGHPIDCYAKTRRALEYTIFAARCFEKPTAGEKWFLAGQSEEHWKQYRGEFRIFYLTEKDKAWAQLSQIRPELDRLFTEYETLSRYSHATILSGGPYFVDTDNGQVALSFSEKLNEIMRSDRLLDEYSFLVRAHGENLEVLFKLCEYAQLSISENLVDLFRMVNADVVAFAAQRSSLREEFDANAIGASEGPDD